MASRKLTAGDLEGTHTNGNGASGGKVPKTLVSFAGRSSPGKKREMRAALQPGRQVTEQNPWGHLQSLATSSASMARDASLLEATRMVRDFDPQASMAIWNFLRLLNPGHDLKCYVFAADGSETEEAGKGQAICDDLARRVGQEHGGGLDNLTTVLGLMAMTYGAVAMEVAPKAGINEIEDWYPITPTLLTFERGEDPEDPDRLVLGQIINGKFIPVNEEQVFYQPLDPDVGDPYGRPPMISAVQTVMSISQMLSDLRQFAHNQGYPRLDVSVDWEALQKIAPPQTQSDPDLFAAWAEAQLKGVISNYDDLAVDDTFLHFSYVNVESVGAGGTFPFDAMEKILTRRLNQAMKTLPILVGINESTSETHGSIQWQIQVAGIKNFQRLIKRLVEKAANISLQMAGVQGHAKMEFQEIRTVDRLYEAQSDFFDARNAQMARQEGWIDNDEAAERIVGHVSVDLPGDEKQRLFNTMQLLLATGADISTAATLSAGGAVISPELLDEFNALQQLAPEPETLFEPPSGEAGAGAGDTGKGRKFKMPDGKADMDLAWKLALERSVIPQKRQQEYRDFFKTLRPSQQIDVMERLAIQRLSHKPVVREAWEDVGSQSRIDKYADLAEKAFLELEPEIARLLDDNGMLDRDAAKDAAAAFRRSLARQMKPILRQAIEEGLLLAGVDAAELPTTLVERLWKTNTPYIEKLAGELRLGLKDGSISSLTDIAEFFQNNAWRERLMGRYLGKQGISAGFAFATSRLGGRTLFKWVRTIEESCPTCTDRGEAVFSYDELLSVGFPGSDRLVCGANCRCVLQPVEARAVPLVDRR